MMSPDELLRELGELATSLGPAMRPTGTDELLRSLTETARRVFGAAATQARLGRCVAQPASNPSNANLATSASGNSAALHS